VSEVPRGHAVTPSDGDNPTCLGREPSGERIRFPLVYFDLLRKILLHFSIFLFE
jgi:hypothetical protein